MRPPLAALGLVACYGGVDNSDCAIRCGEADACPENLSCVATYCVAGGQTCGDPALALAYSFDSIEGGEVFDDSFHNNFATTHGGIEVVEGVHGNAASFDGDGDYTTTRHAPILAVAPGGAFTVSFWIFIEPKTFTSDQIIVAKVVKNGETINPFYEFGVEFDQSTLTIELFVGDDQDIFHVAYTVPPPIGEFAHVAFTYDGTTFAGYLNGALADTPILPELMVTIPDRGQDLIIGSQSNPNEFFEGKLDDLRIYSRALGVAEINTDRNTPVAP